MAFVSKNPATQEILAEFIELTDIELENKLLLAEQSFKQWRLISMADRAKLLTGSAKYLRDHSQSLAKIISLEMGKPIKAAISEVEKCAWVCEFYADKAGEFLAPENIKTEAKESYINFEPLGIVLAVMPWNFPFWQVFRFAAPALMAGNAVVVKHASNVPQSALAVERVFIESGFASGMFQNLFISSARVAQVIEDDRIQAVTLTGSEAAGQSVAAIAGKAIKKTVLELGGSDPFIVLKDAEVDLSCEIAVTARLQNAGQTCVAAKRFIVAAEVYDEFCQKLESHYKKMVIGDPMNEITTVGPLATENILLEVERQVIKSVAAGAKVLVGGLRLDMPGNYYAPTILLNVKPGMPVYNEEVFGPVAAIIKVKDEIEAVKVANDTRYCLGASLWTQDLVLAKKIIPQLQAGVVVVNGMVRSDPNLPFGGVKKSGYGRELSSYGIKEFVNIKSVFIK